MRKFFASNIVYWFLIFCPVIDIITSIMMAANVNVTIGVLLKAFILMFVCIYLIFFDKNKKINYIILGLIFIFSLGNIVNNIDLLKTNMFSYISYLIKYNYYVIMLLYFIKTLKLNKFDFNKLKITIFILALMIFISNITGLYFYSYDASRFGNSGWYSSANELSSLLSLFYPLTIFLFLDRKTSKYVDVLLVIIIAFGLINLGTKVGLFAFILTNSFYLIYRLINLKKYKLNYSFYSVLAIFAIAILFFNSLPTTLNIKNKYDFISNQESVEEDSDENSEVIQQYENNIFVKLLFSGRLNYLQEIQKDDRTAIDYIFGKVYIKNSQIMLIESDLFDIFYMFGIFGFLILYGFLVFMLIKTIRKFFKNFINSFQYLKIMMILFSIVIVILISILVGHTITSPSTSIYLAFLCAYIYTYDEFKKIENNKKQILIGSVHMKVGGIETVLVNLLNSIDYDKYDVDLYLLLKNGENLEKINKNVRILTPYNKIFEKFYAKESKLSKVFKHLLFNRFTSIFFVKNKKYDIAIDFSGYYLFIDKLISNSNAEKKLIWVHTDLEKQYENSSSYRKKINIHRRKYLKYDKVVCVSESCKDVFIKLFPEYEKKATVVWNLTNIKFSKLNNKEKLIGTFKIVSVGRLCYPKNYEMLIKLHKKLLENNYRVNTYIIGDGEDYLKLKNLIEKYNLSESCVLLGKKVDVINYISQCDLFVSTSKYEALPTVLLEALTAGTPWVGPNVTGIRDIYKISPKKSAILTKNNFDSLYDGIVAAINGEVDKNFKFNIKTYNKRALKMFYDVIGEE